MIALLTSNYQQRPDGKRRNDDIDIAVKRAPSEKWRIICRDSDLMAKKSDTPTTAAIVKLMITTLSHFFYSIGT